MIINRHGIKIYSKEADDRGCMDIRAQFMGEDIVVHSLPHAQMGRLQSTVRAFEAAAKNLYIEDKPHGASLQRRNAHESGAPTHQTLFELGTAVQKTLMRDALTPAGQSF